MTTDSKQLTVQDCRRCKHYRHYGWRREPPVWWAERCDNTPTKDDGSQYTRVAVNGEHCQYEEASK